MKKLFTILTMLTLVTLLSSCMPDSKGSSKSRWLNTFDTTDDTTGEEETEETVTVERPEGVELESDYCACKEKVAYNIGNCDSFCSDKNDLDLTLYVNVTLGTDILLNESLGDLYNWCNVELSTDELVPSCQLVADYNNSDTALEASISSGSTQFSSVITTLDYDKTYLIHLEEKVSGVKSSTIQLRLKESIDTSTPLGPLQVTPLNMYTCITRSGTTTGSDNYYEQGAMNHYYFPDYAEPPNLPAGNDFLFCHDVNKYGNTDSADYPRLFLEDGFMHFWSETDIRFYDQDENGKLDVNDDIETSLEDDYGVTGASINIFTEFQWWNYPGAESTTRMGYVMQPWIDNDGNPFCPTSDNYNTAEPTFQILKDLVGADTEGLYLAEKESESFVADDGTVTVLPPDYMLIRQGLLNQIWFYTDDDMTPIPADGAASEFKQIKYYWPADTVNPLTKKSYQKTYLVKSPSQIGSSDDGVDGLRTSVTPSDKRIACVPKMQ